MKDFNLINATSTVYRKYCCFKGRASRAEYWWFQLFSQGIGIILSIICCFLVVNDVYDVMNATGGKPTFEEVLGEITPVTIAAWVIFALFALASFLPALGVLVRRLHDTGRSGWNFCWNFIPYIGPIIVFIFTCLQGTEGPNEYGEGPDAPLD